MQYYTFTTWEQVRDWIDNSGLVRWAFAAERDKEGKLSQYVVNSDWYPGTMDEKLATTRKALEQQPGRYLYGQGWHNDNKTGGEASCEVMMAIGNQQGVAGFPMMPGMQYPQAQPVGEIERQKIADQVRKEVLAEVERKQYERDKAAFEAEKKEYQKEKESFIGLAVNYAKPLIAAMKERAALANVAGTGRDASKPIFAKPIQPVTTDKPAEQEHADSEQGADDPHDAPITGAPDPSEEGVFTADEAEKLEALLTRFRAVEPDYIRLLESVVAMAEAGDSTYTMAKGFLLK